MSLVLKTAARASRGGKIETSCSYCGAGLSVFRCHMKEHKNHFCGQACYHGWMSKNQRGATHPRWKGGPVSVRCAQCGENISRRKADIIEHERHFCSKECDGKWRSENLRGAVIYNYNGGIKAARERRKNSIKERLNARMRTMIRLSLRGNKNGYSWESLAGYSSTDLRKHLQKTMPTGMTWADFMAGNLEIDHIIPQAAFNITSASDIDFKKCWALKNLQLLQARKNRQKGARMQSPFQPSLAIQVAI